MHQSLSADRTRWTVAVAGAAGTLLACLFLFRAPEISLPTAQPTSGTTATSLPKVQIAKSATGDAVLADELLLRDMRPLFLPTDEFNIRLPEPQREAGRTFLSDETWKPTFGETELAIEDKLPAVATLNDKSAGAAKGLDALARDAGAIPLQGLGRQPVEVPAVARRGGFIEVVAMATGHQVFAEVLPLEAAPKTDKAWEPLELMASVDPAGLVAPLVVTSSSRVEEADAHFRNYLARVYRIGDRLPPGFYRITIGP